MSETDRLDITIKFNKKKMKFDDEGENAYATFRKVVMLFTEKVNDSNSSDESEITF